MLWGMKFSVLSLLALVLAVVCAPAARAQGAPTPNANGSLVGTVPPLGYASVEVLWPAGAPGAFSRSGSR